MLNAPILTDLNAENVVFCGDPVDMSSGEKVLQREDLRLSGAIDLVWKRLYRSGLCCTESGLGLGWRSNFHYSLSLQVEEQDCFWRFIDDQGRSFHFTYGGLGSKSSQVRAGMVLQHQSPDQVKISLRNGKLLSFDLVDDTWLLKRIGLGGHHHYRLEYSSAHRLIQISVNAGRSFCLRYDLDGQLIEVLSSRSPDAIIYIRYDYDQCGQLISAAYRGQQAENYSYDKGLLVKCIRPSGFTHYFRWQGEGNEARCIKQWGDEHIYHYRFEYAQEGHRSSNDSLDNLWRYQYDDNGQLISKTSPGGQCWEYRYDSLQRCVARTRPTGATSQTRYSTKGQVSARIDPLGYITTYYYNILGQVTRISYPDGSSLQRDYNSLGLIVEEQLPSGEQRHLRYDHISRLCLVENSHHPNQQYWWNEQDQLVAEKLGDRLTLYSYNEHGERNGVVDANNKVSQFVYLENGQLGQLMEYQKGRPDNQQSQNYHYDEAGRLNAYSDRLGRTTRFQYQGLAQPHRQINPDGSWLRFDYDKECNLTGIERSDGCRYEISYNDNGQIAQTIGFDGRTQDYHYTPDGDLEHLYENGERCIRLKRDSIGRIVERRSMGPDGLMQYEHYRYDCMGRITEASNAQRHVYQSYYDNGELRQEIQGGFVIDHQLNERGQRGQTCLPDGTLVGFSYNDDGVLSHLSVNGKEVLRRVFDNSGNETGRIFRHAQMRQQWNHHGQVSRQQWVAHDLDQSRDYHYDQGNQLNQVEDSENGCADYRYDDRGQLKERQLNSFANPGEGSYKNDRLLAFRDSSFHYDDFGNQIGSIDPHGRQERVFNGLNQLVRLNCQGQASEYSYDAIGRRCTKVTEAGQTDFIWDKQRLLGEYCGGCYRWFIYESGSHRPLILIDDGVVYTYQCDHLGTPIGLLDGEGQIAWQASYHAYGAIKELKQNRIDNPVRFQGHYYDDESGLHYNYHRYYSPEQGRYIQQDPIGLAGGLNPYRYTRNPINQVNPLGLECADTCTLDTSIEEPLLALVAPVYAEIVPDQTNIPGVVENSVPVVFKEDDNPECVLNLFALQCNNVKRNYISLN